jgi:2'-5' RNA ligase
MVHFFTATANRKPPSVVGMRTVELTLDDELDDSVREAWRRLAAAGLPSLATHTHPTNRPHLTLAAGADVPDLAPLLAALPLPVTVDGLIFFEGRTGALAWRVHADETLRSLQAQVWQALDGQARNPLHAPDRWVPHISLARRAAPTAAGGVLDALTPASGWLVGARSYDTETRTAVPIGR